MMHKSGQIRALYNIAMYAIQYQDFQKKIEEIPYIYAKKIKK